ncbi:serine aminopeptidase S33 domain-containing protein [Chloropicon primus]|nr:serine aminopeptidase S33 domain-containing protein [Chloropicon primus]
MVREDGADVEFGFDALARGVFAKAAPSSGQRRRSKPYRSKARRYAEDLKSRATERKSCLHALGDEGDVTASEARQRSEELCERILRMAGRSPTPHDDALLLRRRHEEGKPMPPMPPSRFVGATTGMQLRRLEWGASTSSGEPAVVLLHGIGEAAEAWNPIASKLAQHGFRVHALDLRGHGQTSWSSSQQYDPQSMVADLKDFVLDLDLYKAPIAVAGVGVGAAVATEFASAYPKLVGLLVRIDYNPLGDDSRLRYCKIQGAKAVPTPQAALALLTSPLMREQRRTASSAKKAIDSMFTKSGGGELRPRMDPNFVFGATKASLGLSLASVECETVFLHTFTESEIEELRQCNVRASFRSLEKSSGFAVADSPFEVYAELKKLLNKTELFLDDETASRTPESLGLRPLPQYASLEEAFKALGPRKIPDRESIQAELDKLRTEGDPSSEDEADASGTGLSQNPSDYFGMVG